MERFSTFKLSFFDSINLTNDLTPGDFFVDLDSNVNISFNRIEINSSALPNFNKSAQLKLYNLTFSNPRILKDGSLCSLEECQIVSYLGGTLIFNVTGFSVYSAEETPASVIPSRGGGGGEEPTNVEETTKEDIYFSVENLKFFLKQGESLKKSFIVANNGEKDVKFDIFVSESLKEIISLVEPYHTLSSGDSKVMVVQSFSGEENPPDLYIGYLIFDFGDFKKFLSMAIQIESKNSLFDVELFLSREKKRFLPGDNLNFIVSLRNMAGDPKLGDVSLEYLIKDSNGNLILSSQESYAVETTASKEATLKLPSDLIRGKYYVYVKVDYKGGNALAYQEFFVRSFPLTKVVYGSIVLFSLFLLFVAFFLIIRNRNNRKISRNKS
jgi:hypothetical protein